MFRAPTTRLNWLHVSPGQVSTTAGPRNLASLAVPATFRPQHLQPNEPCRSNAQGTRPWRKERMPRARARRRVAKRSMWHRSGRVGPSSKMGRVSPSKRFPVKVSPVRNTSAIGTFAFYLCKKLQLLHIPWRRQLQWRFRRQTSFVPKTISQGQPENYKTELCRFFQQGCCAPWHSVRIQGLRASIAVPVDGRKPFTPRNEATVETPGLLVSEGASNHSSVC